MRLRTLWLAAALVGAACAAQAQPFQGLYIGAGAVAAGGPDELLDRPAGAVLDESGDREGGKHDGQVRLDRVAGVVEHRPGA